jgi:peptidyl-prolyl cis-trans isomerase B (cyclophilin B)
VLGHISLSQIKRTEEGGRGIALAATILGYIITGIAILTTVAAALIVFVNRPSVDKALTSPKTTAETSPPVTTSSSATGPAPSGVLPPFNPPAGLGANCSYPAGPQPAAKDVTPPPSGQVATDPPVLKASMTTSQGGIGLKLDNAKSPCTVNSFASLVRQGYFDDTRCHRLTSGRSLSVLQCGDPTGDGTGGPGYEFANEYPTNQYQPGDPDAQQPVIYPRGTLAMANAGPDTNGSQFFLVYQDSLLPPQYTVFGTVDASGLATLDKIAAAGTVDGSEDGPPKTDVVITSAHLD